MNMEMKQGEIRCFSRWWENNKSGGDLSTLPSVFVFQLALQKYKSLKSAACFQASYQQN